MPAQLAIAVRYDDTTTRFVLRNDSGILCWGELQGRVDEIAAMDPNLLPCHSRLDCSLLYPPRDLHTKKYEGDLEDPKVFIKTCNFLVHQNFDKYLHIFKILTKREVEVCEILAKSPHPNICPYLGVVTDSVDRIVGIVYSRYDTDFHALVSSNSFDWSQTDQVLGEIRAGMQHMHNMGIVHCDIRPQNIFIKGNAVVIGDFDGAKFMGELLTGKTSTAAWWPARYIRGVDKVDRGIDEYMVDRFKNFIEAWKKIHEESESKCDSIDVRARHCVSL